MNKILMAVLGAAIVALGTAATAEAAYNGACRDGNRFDASCIERTLNAPSQKEPIGVVKFSGKECGVLIARASNGTFALFDVKSGKRPSTGTLIYGDADALSSVGFHVVKAKGRTKIETTESGLTAAEAVGQYVASCK